MPNSILVEEYVLITHFYSFIGHGMIYNQKCQYSQWVNSLQPNVCGVIYVITAHLNFHPYSNGFQLGVKWFFFKFPECLYVRAFIPLETSYKSKLKCNFFLAE